MRLIEFFLGSTKKYDLFYAELISHLSEFGMQYCIDNEDSCKSCKEIVRLNILWTDHENTP